MWTALITGLVALAGALGGTHLANRSTERRERAQRLHDFRTQQYNDAAKLFSDHIGNAIAILTSMRQNNPVEAERVDELAIRYARIAISFPDMAEPARALLSDGYRGGDAQAVEDRYMEAATETLRKLQPDEAGI